MFKFINLVKLEEWGEALIYLKDNYKFLNKSIYHNYLCDALISAINKNQYKFVNFLVSRINVEEFSDFVKYEALEFSLKKKNLKMSRILIKHGADVNGKFDSQFASKIEFDLNCLSYDTNFIFISISTSDYDSVKLLIKNGANVNVEVKSLTPLHCAAILNDVKMMKILIDNGANIDGKIGSEEENKFLDVTPLMKSIEFDSKEATSFLIKHGASLNDKTRRYGDTALHLSCFNGMTDIVRKLCKAGADVSIKDVNGDTPLHIAAKMGFPEIIKILIKYGANISEENNKGMTPIQVAAKEQKKESVEALIKFGKDKGSNCSSDGKNSIDYLFTPEQIEIFNILSKKEKKLKNIFN